MFAKILMNSVMDYQGIDSRLQVVPLEEDLTTSQVVRDKWVKLHYQELDHKVLLIGTN